MQKPLWREWLAAIILIWALWNYEITLKILGSAINILMPFILGGAIAFVVNVLLAHLETGWQIAFKGRFNAAKRPVCLTLSFALITGIVVLLFINVVPELHNSLKVLAAKVPEALTRFNVYLHERIAVLNLSDNDIAYIQQEWKKLTNAAIVFWESNKGTLLSRTWNMTTSFVGTVTNVVIGVVFAIYILLDKERLAHSGRRAVYAFCSRENAGYWLNAASLSKKVFAGFVGGQLLEAFLLGLMCFAGMLILSMPYALVISALVAFLALVPIIGTMVSAVIGCVFILISQPEKVLPFIIFFIVLQRIEGDILYPRVVGKSVGLSGLWVLAAVTVGHTAEQRQQTGRRDQQPAALPHGIFSVLFVCHIRTPPFCKLMAIFPLRFARFNPMTVMITPATPIYTQPPTARAVTYGLMLRRSAAAPSMANTIRFSNMGTYQTETLRPVCLFLNRCSRS